MWTEFLARLSVGIKVCAVLTLVALLLHIVGFSTTYWYVGPNEVAAYYSVDGNTHEHYGLWWTCIELSDKNIDYYTYSCWKFTDLDEPKIIPLPANDNKGMCLFIQ